LQAKELLDAPSGTTLTQLADVEYDCDDLASEAAEVSTSEDAALKLLKVRTRAWSRTTVRTTGFRLATVRP